MQKDQKVQLAVPQLEWRVFTAVTPRGNPHNSGQRPADRPTTRDSALVCVLCGTVAQFLLCTSKGVCTLWNSSLLLCSSKGVRTLWNSNLSLCTSKGVCTLWNSGLLLCTWKGVGTLWNSSVLLCTSTSKRAFTLWDISLLSCISKHVLFVRHHVLFVRHRQNARVPCVTSVFLCALGNNSSFLLVCYLVSHCENHSLVQLSGQCTLAKIRSARWNSIVETQQSQSKNRWRSIAEWEVAEETRRAGLGMSIASSVLWPPSLSSMTIVSLAKVT